MATVNKARSHPKNNRLCVFCKSWSGDSELTAVSKAMGCEYYHSVMGKCLVKGGSRVASSAGCSDYAINYEASRVM